MTHLGQRLSALIDGELEAWERERVLVHVTNCGSCSDEVAALHALKQRISATFGETAASAGMTGLTSRLMGLSDLLLDLDGRRMPTGGTAWPPPPPPAGWPAEGRPSQDGASGDRDRHPDQRFGRFFLAGSVAIFLAGLGTAAVIAGGEPQARAPAPPVTPSVDVLVAPHNSGNQELTGGAGVGVNGPWARDQWSRSDMDITRVPGQP